MHPTVKVSRGEIEIDVKLAPLIPLLWARGLETNQCCQAYRPGEACVEFRSEFDVMEFLNVTGGRRCKVETETWDEGENGEHSFVVRLLVFFPTRDIPRLVKAFKDAKLLL